MTKLKVLHVVGQLTIGGQETMVMNFCRFADRRNVVFDFLVYGDKIGEFEAEAESMGGKVIHAPSLNEVGYHKYINELSKIMDNNGPYDAIHCHTSFNSGFIMKVANKKGIPVRITHSHTTMSGKKSTLAFRVYAKIMRRLILKNTTVLLACGNEAGMYLFGKDVFMNKGRVIKNGINPTIFSPNLKIRNEIRKEYNVEGKFVIGHVGRMSTEKNHKFLIEVFNEIHKRDKETILIFVGTGSLFNDLKNQVRKLGLEDSVIFAGQSSNVPNMLQLIDVFVFPSIYEGLPVSVIEAQASGLPCIISNNITQEIKITELVEFISLDEKKEVWADHILEKKNFIRKNNLIEIEKSGYDIIDSCKQLERLYSKGELK